jgi:hypothetical protein
MAKAKKGARRRDAVPVERFMLGLSTRKMGTGTRPRTRARESPTVAGPGASPHFPSPGAMQTETALEKTVRPGRFAWTCRKPITSGWSGSLASAA